MTKILKIISNPSFWDIFGIATFLFITITASRSLITNNPYPKFGLIILLIIGIAGLIIDGVMVARAFLFRATA